MTRWKRWFRLGPELAAVLLLPLVAGCTGSNAPVGPRSSLFVGIDVSGSFQKSGRYDDALLFAAYYIHAHLTGVGDLERPKNLFVGSIGGDHPGQPQAFHPIEDFQGKSVGRIAEDLRRWFPANEPLTDFNAFFKRTATEVKRRGLVLTPITLVILSDGVPDLGQKHGDATAAYRQIDLKPLEYLARRVTVRLLYANPEVAAHWEHDVPRDRVRLWTVDNVVMAGWAQQLLDTIGGGASASAVSQAGRTEMAAGGAGSAASAHDTSIVADSAALASLALAMHPQSEPDDFLDSVAAETTAAPVYPPGTPALWRWIRDNVDFRVRERVL
jgi:hypothetical protein